MIIAEIRDLHLSFNPNGWEDYLYRQDTDPKPAARINELLKDILGHAFEGTGKPEPLRNDQKGYWSKRIHHEHRIIYAVSGKGDEQTVIVIQCHSHC